jgi:hypothetical protein
MGIAASLTKMRAFQGHDEYWSNVYHYVGDEGAFDEGNAATVLDQLLAAERPVHSNAIRFVEGRVWRTPSAVGRRDTVLVRDETASGTATESDTMYIECAYLIQWRTARPSATGRPVYLRKFIHACSTLGSSTGGMQSGRTQLGTTERGVLTTYARAVDTVTWSTVTLPLGSESGRIAPEAGEQIFPYLEHRQFPFTGRRPPRTA